MTHKRVGITPDYEGWNRTSYKGGQKGIICSNGVRTTPQNEGIRVWAAQREIG